MMSSKIKTLFSPSLKNSGQWLKLVNYGDHPHPKGLQRVTKTSGAKMMHAFNSFSNKVRGLPVYIGHPDDPEYEEGSMNARIYGRIKALEAREEAIWFYVKWTEQGHHIYQSRSYRYFSPRWEMRNIGADIFEPIRLVSVRMKMYPNIKEDNLLNIKSMYSNVLSSLNNHSQKELFLSRINQRMDSFGEDYTTAWQTVRNQEKGLYDRLFS